MSNVYDMQLKRIQDDINQIREDVLSLLHGLESLRVYLGETGDGDGQEPYIVVAINKYTGEVVNVDDVQDYEYE